MNKEQSTASLAIVGMALLATITMISPTQALALGHWNLNEDSTPDGDVAESGMDSSGASENTDEEVEVENSANEEEEDSTTTATTGDDEEEEEGSSDKEQNSSSSVYEAFQKCLAEIEESPTADEVQDCIESSYGGQVESEDAPSESADEGDEGETGVTQDSTNDLE